MCRSPWRTKNVLAPLTRDFHLTGDSEIDSSVYRSISVDLNNNTFAQHTGTKHDNQRNQQQDIVEMYERNPTVFGVHRSTHNSAFKHFPHLQSQSEKSQTEIYQLLEASKRAYLSVMTPWWQTPLSFRPHHFHGDALSLRFHQLHSYLSSSMYVTSSNVLPLAWHSPTTNYDSLKVKDECCSTHVEEHKDVDQSKGKESILWANKKSGTKLMSVLKERALFRFLFKAQIPVQIIIF